MARPFGLLAVVVAGAVLAGFTDLGDLDDAGWYGVLTATLLAVGLYTSTHAIVVAHARRHMKLIVLAITVGVFAKAALIGGALVVIFGDPVFWILGIAVAQIDPLSVAALLRNSPMSPRAKTILVAWSSFDDPMTVLLALYVPALIVSPQVPAALGTSGGLADYSLGLGMNLAFAAVVGAAWWFARRKVPSAFVVLIIGCTLLILSFAVAIGYLLMLGLALIGLFLRPDHIDPIADWSVRIALAVATFGVGIMLADGIDLVRGAALGVAAVAAQVIVGGVLTRRLPRQDRWYLSFAQQNGITAIILSLLLEPAYPGTIAVVAPAIVVVNVLHAVANKLLNRRLVSVN
ncbi:MAG: hypothetical protein ACRDPW_00235 [Mycobacteriales bacterium]